MTTTISTAPFTLLDLERMTTLPRARNAFELESLRLFRQIPAERKAEVLAKLEEIAASLKPPKGKRRKGDQVIALKLPMGSKTKGDAALEIREPVGEVQS